MIQLLGFILGLASIYFSLSMLQQSLTMYFDMIALIMVVGGTLCVLIMTFPIKEIGSMLKLVFSRSAKKRDAELVAQFVNLSKLSQAAPGRIAIALENPKVDPFLKEGIELILGGFKEDEIEMILGERLYNKRVEDEQAAGILKSLSKYPPAFGLMGTVLGLVSVMRGMGEGSSPEETGLRMAVALIATLYGLVVTNLILLPTSEMLMAKVKKRVALEKFIIEGVLLLKERSSPLLVQEILNSYVTRADRKDFVGISGKPTEARPNERGVA